MTTAGGPGIAVTTHHGSLDYDRLADKYLPQYWNMIDSHINLVRLADLRPGMTVLDAACGPGIVGYLASQRLGGPQNVYFVDVSRRMVQEAKQAIRDEYGNDAADKRRFLCANLLDPAVIAEMKQRRPGGFDVVFAHLFLSHFTAASQPQVLRSLLDLCGRGGVVALDLPLPSPSRHIDGKPTDETTLGVRQLVIRSPTWRDVRLDAVLPTCSFTTTIGADERSRARAEAARLAAAANGAIVKGRDSIDLSTATDDVSHHIREAGQHETDRKVQGSATVVKTDFARRVWLDAELDSQQWVEPKLGDLYAFRLSYAVHVLVRR